MVEIWASGVLGHSVSQRDGVRKKQRSRWITSWMIHAKRKKTTRRIPTGSARASAEQTSESVIRDFYANHRGIDCRFREGGGASFITRSHINTGWCLVELTGTTTAGWCLVELTGTTTAGWCLLELRSTTIAGWCLSEIRNTTRGWSLCQIFTLLSPGNFKKNFRRRKMVRAKNYFSDHS